LIFQKKDKRDKRQDTEKCARNWRFEFSCLFVSSLKKWILQTHRTIPPKRFIVFYFTFDSSKERQKRQKTGYGEMSEKTQKWVRKKQGILMLFYIKGHTKGYINLI